jgi:hypothetical protein
MVLHAVILLCVGLTLQPSPRKGAAAERTAEVGIALKSQEGQRQFYQSDADGGRWSERPEANRSDQPSLSDVLAQQAPLDPTPSLPSPMKVLGRGALGERGVPNAAALRDGPDGRPGSIGGKGRATMFGITGEGWKFVYVLDCSDSMNWRHQRPLRAAKSELLASLESLQKVHRFQIIFYNEDPHVFNPSGRQNRLAFATEQNKRNARNFVQGIVASGGTEHFAALMAAIRLAPDVIFFLTDAGDPQLSPGELSEIQRRAAGIAIHAIEFGLGPQRDANNFLVRLAWQNGGEHRYVDLSALLPREGSP